MKKQDATQLLENTFGQQFDIQQFAIFTKELFNVIQIDIQDKSPYIASQYKEYIEKCWKIGQYKDSERKEMEVLVVQLKKASSRDRARTMQRNFISTWLGKIDIDGALVAFYGEDPEDWRFSFVKMEYNLVKDENGKVKVAKELTPAKRYSYLVGVNEPNHTCRSQFLDIVIEENINPTMSGIEQAFSIDKVTKEFFEKYKELVIDVKESMDRIITKDANVRREFENRGIATIDFSKKLMGQIVFIYFLQKKGWLGVEKQTDSSFREWGTGPKNFLRKLFKKDIVSYDNFFNDMLEPLFYEALANDRSADNDYYSRFKCKIPFLNGGLFEPINEYDWTGTDIIIPNSVFGKILDTFDRFNFTVKEDEPLEKEVAVDPEMLGKVFENLLEVKERKDKGAFYTPREIVHYMCQQSLIIYLKTNTDDIPREDIDKFIRYGDLALDQTIKALAQKEIYHGKSYVDDKYLIPKFIADNFVEIDKLLQNIKIVDPAVGSGAFPIGMMNEIVKARSILSIYFSPEEREKRTEYNLKRECIENSLYGVDIEPSAVEIAKLRFWLSLIVNEMDIKRIKPLPNLEHKIMCGNSLLEEFEGITLFDERLLGEIPSICPIEAEIKSRNQQISQLNAELGSLEFGGLSSQLKEKVKKLKSLKMRKKELEKRLKTKRKAKEKDTQKTMDEALQQRIRESQLKLRELKKLYEEFFNEPNRNRKIQLREDMDRIEWELIEATLKEQGNEEAMEKLKQYKRTNVKPFFLWKLYFMEIFQRETPGFDLVIGNPPYIQLQNKEKISPDLQQAYEKVGYQTFTKRGDIYCLFHERANRIMRKSGTLTFITSNKWMRADYGKKFREYLLRNVSINQLIDFGDAPIFEGATTYTNILISSKESSNTLPRVWDLSSLYSLNIPLEKMLVKYGCGECEFDEDSFIILSKKQAIIKEKIEKIGTPLKDWDIRINYGIKTGYNEAFIINGKTREELIANNPKNADLIKPILRGRDIKRYNIQFADLWLLFIPWHFPLHKDNRISGNSTKAEESFKEQYPALYNHLLQHKEKLCQRNKAEIGIRYEWYVLQRCAASYYEEFEKEKIIYAEIVYNSAFSYDTNRYFTDTTAFILTGENLKFLTSLLNSKFLTYAFKLFYAGGDLRGNTFRYKKVFLEKLPVPKLESNLQTQFIELVDQILSITDEDDYLSNPRKQTEVSVLEQNIDKLVYELYDLTDEEIMIVEGHSGET